MNQSLRSNGSSRTRAAIGRLVVRGLRHLARWGGAKPPPGGWRDDSPHAFRPARPLKRTHLAERQRERGESRAALLRLWVWLPLLVFALLFIIQSQTPEHMALHRLRRVAATNSMTLADSRVTPRSMQECAKLSFSELSWFDFTVTADIFDGRADPASASAKTVEQIPDSVKRRDGQAAAIEGFMLPLRLEGGKAVEWLLCRDQADCCFGKTPRLNHWVLVRSLQGVKPKLRQPVTCFGTLRVGEMREDGFLIGIYQMDATDLVFSN